MRFVLYLHILGATVWVGGLIVVAGVTPAVRNATKDLDVIRAMARRFGTLSWVALAVQITTGTIMVLDRTWTRPLILKLGLVMVSAMLAAWHSVAARDQSPALRGATQGAILGLGLIIVWLGTGV